jgi:anthranilate phosphoribosyltransferase
MIREILPRLVRGERLAREETAAAIRSIMRGGEDPELVGAFLMALAQRGETADELAGGARLSDPKRSRFQARARSSTPCGTGGDGTHTYNISTVVGLIAAAAGRRVAKHGNRSVSSRCGSADVLEALGARVDLGPEPPCARSRDRLLLPLRAALPSVDEAGGRDPQVARRAHALQLGRAAREPGARLAPAPRRVRSRARRRGGRVLAALGAERALVVHGAGGSTSSR